MTRDKSPQHADAGKPNTDPDAPEPSHAERARTMVDSGRVSSLSTLSRKHPGFPFGSVMPYGLDEGGNPLFLISSMAMHTKNLMADPRASLLVMEPGASSDPLGAGRVTVVGEATRVPDLDESTVRGSYLARHPNASHWVDFGDFSFFRLAVRDLYFVGGFGVMGWVSSEEYAAAQPDPLANDAQGILSHMNADHVDAMLVLAKGVAGVDAVDAKMTSVDRLGFHLRVKTLDRVRGLRIPFDNEARSPADVRRILVEMVKSHRR